MKNLSFLLTILFLAISGVLISAHAQYKDDEKTITYYEIGSGLQKFDNWHLGWNAKFNSNDILSFGFNYHIRLTPQLPNDFTPSSNDWTGNDPLPRQSFALFSMMYGKVLYSRSRFFRFIVRSGFIVGRCDQSIEFKPTDVVTNGGFIYSNRSANYTFKEQILTVTGVVINPVMEIPILRGLGFNMGLYANINNVASIYSLDASLILGQLRNRKVKSTDIQ